MASERSPNLNKSILLVILMITMSQVGYLESMNPWTNGEETLDDAEPIAQSSPATSVMYGNNSTWTPQGPMLTSGYHSSSAIIAVSDEVILFKYQEGYNGDFCLAAYNRYNETSWTPTFNTPIGDDCSDTSGGFEFLGMIGNTTLFTFDEDVGNQNHNHYKGHSIYAYNFDNDTVYRLYRATTLTYQYESEHRDPVMIGNSVYFLEYYITASNNKFRLGVFNFDNQTHWTYHSSLPSNCTDKMTQLLAVSESKLLTNCGSSLYEPFLFNIKNETMYRPNGLNGVTGSIGSTNALVGTQLLFRADGNTGTGYEPWILDVSNDSAWMVEDLNPGTGSSNLANPLRSGTRVLFNINPGQYSGYPVSNFYWYESSNNTIWQATTFTDTVATIGDVAELANGVIVFTTHKTNVHKTKFYNPANGSVWEEPAMCVGKHGSNCDSGIFNLKAVYGNTIFGSVKMNFTTTFGNNGAFQMMAYDLSNNSVQVSWNLGNAGAPQSACMYTNAFVFGDQVMYPWRACSGKVNNVTNIGQLATMIWSPSAIRVSDAWNMSKGDLIETGDPLSGGVGTRYNSGAGIQNLTASVEGADLVR
jgi:ELWxxDGT repeat protein